MNIIYWLNLIILFFSYIGVLICVINSNDFNLLYYFICQSFMNMINLNIKIRKNQIILSKLIIFLNLFMIKFGIVIIFFIQINSVINILIIDLIILNISFYFAIIFFYCKK